MNPDERLQDLLDGALEPHEAEPLRRELVRDRALRERFDALHTVRRALERVARRTAAPPGFEDRVLERLGLHPRIRRRAWLSRGAAAAALVLAAVGLLLEGDPDRSSAPAPAAAPAERALLRRAEPAAEEVSGVRVVAVAFGREAEESEEAGRGAEAKLDGAPLPEPLAALLRRHGGRVVDLRRAGPPGRMRATFALPAERVASFLRSLGALGGRVPAPAAALDKERESGEVRLVVTFEGG